MADDFGDKPIFTEQMPAPPPFWKQFTPENIAQVKELQENGEPVPTTLEVLLPPPPPTDGKYRSFGDIFDVRHSPLLN
jgi:mediator of RNA polymerase II transcription subunit 7